MIDFRQCCIKGSDEYKCIADGSNSTHSLLYDQDFASSYFGCSSSHLKVGRTKTKIDNHRWFN